MFPYEDTEIVSVRPSVRTPRKEITLASSISVLQYTVVIDASMERFSWVPTTAWKLKEFIFFLYAYLNGIAAIFCEQFLAYTVHIDGSAFSCYPEAFK